MARELTPEEGNRWDMIVDQGLGTGAQAYEMVTHERLEGPPIRESEPTISASKGEHPTYAEIQLQHVGEIKEILENSDAQDKRRETIEAERSEAIHKLLRETAAESGASDKPELAGDRPSQHASEIHEPKTRNSTTLVRPPAPTSPSQEDQ